jgi:hypothetical protein
LTPINESTYLNGVYEVYTLEGYPVDTQCYLNFCRNNYVRTTEPCSSNLRFINYTDSNSCPVQYDIPADKGTYEDCSLPPNTDKALWLIIILIIFYFVLLILTVIYPLASVGLLIVSIFTSIQLLAYFTAMPVIVGLLFPIIAVIVGGFAIVLRSGR